jgi:PelA/Pel-15E family pectate lyase
MGNAMRRTDDAFFRTAEARRVGDALLLYQRVTGGWPKNIDMTKPLTSAERAQLKQDKERRDDSTIDNGATSTQLQFLARLYRQTHADRYRSAFRRGVEYLLSGQYDNGGWRAVLARSAWLSGTHHLQRRCHQQHAGAAQRHRHGQGTFDGNLTGPRLRGKAASAFAKGIDCILKTQIRVDGQPTVWCQQHDRDTYLPASARAFELVSYCSQESAGLLRLLMSLPQPDARVKAAIHGGMQWLDDHKITGYRYIHLRKDTLGQMTRLEPDTTAPALWARYYDIDHGEPFVCDRDGIPRRHLSEIGTERRNGYAWYGTTPAALYKLYDKWAARHDPLGKRPVTLLSKGGNERGVFEMFRKGRVDPSQFDVIISPDDNIQDAIGKAPEQGTKPFKILLLKGTYHQKVIIDRPNIVLVAKTATAPRWCMPRQGRT